MFGGKTIICSILYTDIVGFSKLSNAQQIVTKTRLNSVIADAVESVGSEQHLIVDTGDGAAPCFGGDPELALFSALSVRNRVMRAAAQGDPAAFALRMGINLGPVKVVRDVNNRPNVLGDGINVAERVMSFAEPNQILVSRSYYDVVSCLADDYQKLFNYGGVLKDKHIREHEVYEISVESDDPGGARWVQAEALRVAGGGAIERPDSVLSHMAELETALADTLVGHLGPIAGLMARNALAQAVDPADLVRRLAEIIKDSEAREGLTATIKDLVANYWQSAPEQLAKAPEEAAAVPFTSEELALAKARLAKIIGPMAGILVQRAAAGATDLPSLYRALAESIPGEEDRAQFTALVE